MRIFVGGAQHFYYLSTASMFSTSTLPDSVKGDASRERRQSRSIDAPRFGKDCPIDQVSHLGEGASDFHCRAPKEIRNQLTSQSCNGILSAGLTSAQVWKVFY